MREFHKDFFWIYGVIVGLAIREALTQTLHHVFSIPSADAPWILHIESWRTVLFMLMIIRSYIGSIVFFNKVHGPSGPAAGNYYLDFVMGFTQFIFFYAWSVSIFSYSRNSKGISYYLFLMFIILLFDLMWLIFNWRYDTAETLKVLAVVNTLTALISFAVFLGGIYLFEANVQVAEEAAIVPVILVSVLGLADNVSGTPILTRLLQSAMPKQIRPTTAPAPVDTAGPAGPEIGG